MILIFAGAGASKAVGPDKYPTTVEFFQRLPDDVSSDKLFQLAVEYIHQSSKSKTTDIEQVLWTLKDLKEFTSKICDKKSVPGWFIQGNRLSAVSGTGQDLQSLLNTASPANQIVDRMVSKISQVVYDLYADVPDESDLEANWLPLLKRLMELKEPIEIVTTNYDLVIEEAISITNAPVRTGRSQKTLPILETQLWDVTDPSSPASSFGLLTKLHGSVDWVRGRNNRIHVGTPTYQGDHKRHAIIYPGFKGEPTDDLFKQLHLYFQAALSRAVVVVFIGYAFRDEYINTLLSRQLSHEASLIILNPAKNLPLIREVEFTHLEHGFDREGTQQLLVEIERRVF